MVIVIDSSMSAGKTTKMFKELNAKANDDKRFLWVTPYLDEIKRVQGNKNERKIKHDNCD